MDYTNFVRSAAKAKAPIVAIPIEGHAPICLRLKVLAGWAKGVEIQRVEVRQNPPVIEYRRPPREYDCEARQSVQPEGPEARVEIVQPRWVVMHGHPTKAPRIRCTARFAPIARREAIRELAKWTDKERERQEKKRLLGALGMTAAERRALKLLAHGEEGDGIVETNYRVSPELMERRSGRAITLPEMPELRFVIVPLRDEDGKAYQFRVTETITGKAAGVGASAEAAILAARRELRKQGPEKCRSLVATITSGV